MNIEKNVQNRILQLQKKIYTSLLLEAKEAKILLGEMPQTVQAYERSAQKDFQFPKKNFSYFQKKPYSTKFDQSMSLSLQTTTLLDSLKKRHSELFKKASQKTLIGQLDWKWSPVSFKKNSMLFRKEK